MTVQQDISFPKAGVNLKKGQKVTLNGTQAYYYLHGRDTEEYDSATKRLQREEQYIVAYMDKLKKVSTENPDQVTEIYNSVSDYLVTSVDFTSMIEQLMNYGFSEDRDVWTVGRESRLTGNGMSSSMASSSTWYSSYRFPSIGFPSTVFPGTVYIWSSEKP